MISKNFFADYYNQPNCISHDVGNSSTKPRCSRLGDITGGFKPHAITYYLTLLLLLVILPIYVDLFLKALYFTLFVLHASLLALIRVAHVVPVLSLIVPVLVLSIFIIPVLLILLLDFPSLLSSLSSLSLLALFSAGAAPSLSHPPPCCSCS